MTPEEKYRKRKPDSIGGKRKKFRWRHLRYETGHLCFIVDAKNRTPYTAYKWWEWTSDDKGDVSMVDNKKDLYFYYISQYINPKWVPLILLPTKNLVPFNEALAIGKTWVHNIASSEITIFSNDQKTGVLIQKDQGPVLVNVVLVHTDEPKIPYVEAVPEFQNQTEICTMNNEARIKDELAFTLYQYIVDGWVELINLDKITLEENEISAYIEETLKPKEKGVLTFTNNCGSGIITNTKWTTQLKPTRSKYNFG